MPRGPRLEAANCLHHLIARFLNREFLLCGEDERREYLRRVPAALKRTDARLFAYALMSNHVHWACHTGCDRPARFVQPLHGGFAGWLNRHLGRLGPAFGGRFSDVICPEERLAILLAYLHNNPVRAGVVQDPADCDWTSHRAFIGVSRPPPWLDVASSLSACGFDSSSSGRASFHSFVLSRVAEGRDPRLSAEDERDARRRLREVVGAPCEVTDAVIGDDVGPSERSVVVVADGIVRPRWPGGAIDVLRRVAQRCGVDPADVRSRSRRRDTVEVRRLALWVWTRELGRRQREMNGVLGLSCSSGSELLRTRPKMESRKIEGLGTELWEPYRQEREGEDPATTAGAA